MRPFALVFVVFSLLLGRTLCEALAGYSRALTASRDLRPVRIRSDRIGWLVPQLGLVDVLDGWTFWLLAWNKRKQIDANYPTLIEVPIVVAGAIAATLIFPDAIEDRPDLAAWYLPRRRLVLGGLLGANVAN
ncbi:hypothetical protein [uncultured Sphingomonas sp.]|uniref:hypothetical protein n=1 Tax=uncultured Sphingomonas sp. TaxID=158754 RepID=UPI0025D1E0C0|nr:hypothetical protein [uncultured Sphingomonas sp.]